MDNLHDFDKDPIDFLKFKLRTKSVLKQKIWNLALDMFDGLKNEASGLANTLSDKNNEYPEVEFSEIDQHEFNLKFGSDILVFSLQTNIVTFAKSYHVMKSKSVSSNKDLSFFGQIIIYDFMADTIKYHRTDDLGYLLARVLINADNHFVIEGVGGLKYIFQSIEETEATKANLSLLVKKALAVSIDNDLYGSDFSKIRSITLGKKLAKTREIGHGDKIGFQLKDEDEIEE